MLPVLYTEAICLGTTVGGLCGPGVPRSTQSTYRTRQGYLRAMAAKKARQAGTPFMAMRTAPSTLSK